MIRSVTPESFGSIEPPARICGGETEYNIVLPTGEDDGDWDEMYAPEVLEQLGLMGRRGGTGIWLTNGAFLHRDVGHAEYAGPEALGPAEGAATIHAGNKTMAHLLEASGKDSQIFRRSATVDPATGRVRTKGYHLNLCVPDRIASLSSLYTLNVHLVTQVYAHGGIVTTEGYNIMPKSYGIGNPITTVLSTRVQEQGKPLGIIRNAGATHDSDTNSAVHGLGRFEVRCITPGSLWSDFMAFATTSLLARVLEHPTGLSAENRALRKLELVDAPTVFREAGADLAMQKEYPLRDGRSKDVVTIQTELSKIALGACDKLQLPDDEQYGALEWEDICKDLKDVQSGDAPLSLVADRIAWASKYTYFAKQLGAEAIMGGDPTALRWCLNWDRVGPRGGGQIFDEKRGREVVSPAAVDKLVTEPPQETRAKVRSDIIRHFATGSIASDRSIRWPYVKMQSRLVGDRTLLLHPYQTALTPEQTAWIE